MDEWEWVLSEADSCGQRTASTHPMNLQHQTVFQFKTGSRRNLYYGTLTMETHEQAQAVLNKIGSEREKTVRCDNTVFQAPRIYVEWGK
jgi:hypothetical protein